MVAPQVLQEMKLPKDDYVAPLVQPSLPGLESPMSNTAPKPSPVANMAAMPINHRKQLEHTVYLAGPITGLEWGECNDWRAYIDPMLPEHIHPISPLRNKQYLKGTGKLKDAYSQDDVGSILSTGRCIYERDHMDVHRCDAVLCNLLGAERVSIGTVMELAWAKQRGIPVVVAIEKEGNVHEHSMLVETFGFRVDNLEDAVKVLTAILSVGV